MAITGTVVDRMRARLERGYWPRVHCMLILGVSAGAAFLVSFALMTAGVYSMALRYGLAALAAYGTFLFLIDAWVRWKWSRFAPDLDGNIVDVTDIPGNIPMPSLHGGGGGTGPKLFGGGRSGGGGASGGWNANTSSVTTVKSSGGGGHGGGGFSLDLDGDDLFWLIVFLAAAFAGMIAVGYVIYDAPTLMAEAAVNAAVAGKVYHGMQRRESEHWTSQVVRRTAISAAVVILSAVVAGYALQRIAPEARSIGGVWQHLAHHTA